MRARSAGRARVLREIRARWAILASLVLSVVFGSAILGSVLTSAVVFTVRADEAYSAIAPADSLMYTVSGFDETLVEEIRRLPGVEVVEPRLVVPGRTEGDDDRLVQLFVLDDPSHQRAHRVLPESGTWPPPTDGVVLEAASARMIGATEGTCLELVSAGPRQRLCVEGTAVEMSLYSAPVSNIIYGYVSRDVAARLAPPLAAEPYNELIVRATDNHDRDHVRSVTAAVASQLDEAGVGLRASYTVRSADRHDTQDILVALAALLVVMGLCLCLASGVHVANVIHIIVASQTRTVATMKALGASSRRVMSFYLWQAVILSAIALVVAVPITLVAGPLIVQLGFDTVAFDVADHSPPWWVLVVQVVLTVGVCVGSAWVGARTLCHQRVNELLRPHPTAVGETRPHPRRRRAMVDTLGTRHALADRGRLVRLTAATALSVAMIVTVGNLYDGSDRKLDQAFGFWRYDSEVTVAGSGEELAEQVRSLPEVSSAEAWRQYPAVVSDPDGRPLLNLTLTTLPMGSSMIRPSVQEGRWPRPGERSVVVADRAAVERGVPLRVGDTVDLRAGGADHRWEVVGIVDGQLRGYGTHGLMADQVNEDALGPSPGAKVVVDGTGPTTALNSVLIRTADELGAPAFVESVEEIRDRLSLPFGLVTTFLFGFGVVAALVAALSLGGALAAAAAARSKEMTVINAIGGTRRVARRLLSIEGRVLTGIGMVVGVVAAIPLTAAQAWILGMQLVEQPFPFAFNWLGLVVAVAITFASYLLATTVPTRWVGTGLLAERLAAEGERS